MLLIDTDNVIFLLNNGIGTPLIQTQARSVGDNGTIHKDKSASSQFTGMRFTHVVLDANDFRQLLQQPELYVRLIKHFRIMKP